MMTMLSSARATRSFGGKAVLAVLCLASAPTPVCAQRVVAQTAAPQALPPAAPPPALSDQNAQETRQQLQELLANHPPALREVLQRDPGLLSNAEYLAPYPRVANFLASHPEVARSPVYFVGEPERHPIERSDWMWRQMLESLSIAGLFLLGGLGFGWLVRTALDHRRWQRVSRIQVDTHSKLLDRLTSSDDLRAYMASPAGRQFLESAPIALDGQTQAPLAAPLSRILWSMQVGFVTLLGGVALHLVSRSVVDDAAEPLRVLGVVLVAIGAGFLLSAGLSYALSRHLGLLRPAEPASRPSVPQV